MRSQVLSHSGASRSQFFRQFTGTEYLEIQMTFFCQLFYSIPSTTVYHNHSQSTALDMGVVVLSYSTVMQDFVLSEGGSLGKPGFRV